MGGFLFPIIIRSRKAFTIEIPEQQENEKLLIKKRNN